jgi:Tol biopolymer transport system component
MRLSTIGREGKAMPLPVMAGFYETPRVSPDGTRLAIATSGSDANVWIYDLAGTAAIRQLTFGGRNRSPVWTGNGEHVAFQSDRGGDVAVWSQRADGTGPVERLTIAEAGSVHTPEAWSSRDERLLYDVARNSTHALWMFSLKDRSAAPVADIEGSRVPIAAAVSPDGRWIAHQFGVAGPATFPSIFIRPFPATPTKYRVTSGLHPFWSPDGRELFYNQGPSRSLAVVPLDTEPVVTFGEPRSLSQTVQLLEGGIRAERDIDVLPDGRFVSAVAFDPSSSQTPAPVRLELLLNWVETLASQPARP